MDTLAEWWRLARDVWAQGLHGTSFGRYLIALLIIAAFLLLRRLLSRFILNRLRHLAEKSRTRFDDSLLSALERPARFLPIILGLFFATQYLDLTGTAALFAHNVNRSLIVFVIFWALFNLVEPLSLWGQKLERIFTPSLVEWMIKAIRGGLVFIGGASILELWGIKVGPIIAGLGLLGVAVALGAQDLFKNLISGILILAERRFMRGDWIRVDGVVEGTVESIGFRSTLIRRFDKAPVFVPNTKLSDSPVINFSKMTHRRIYWKIGIKNTAGVDQLRRIRDGIAEHINTGAEFAKPPEAELFVRYDRIGDSSIDLMLYCFTRTIAWGEWLRIQETLAYRIKQIVETAGAGFALPGRSLYVETLPGEAPEIFTPPSDAPEGPTDEGEEQGALDGGGLTGSA